MPDDDDDGFKHFRVDSEISRREGGTCEAASKSAASGMAHSSSTIYATEKHPLPGAARDKPRPAASPGHGAQTNHQRVTAG